MLGDQRLWFENIMISNKYIQQYTYAIDSD